MHSRFTKFSVLIVVVNIFTRGSRPPNLDSRPPNFGSRPPNFGSCPPNFGSRPPELGRRLLMPTTTQPAPTTSK